MTPMTMPNTLSQSLSLESILLAFSIPSSPTTNYGNML